MSIQPLFPLSSSRPNSGAHKSRRPTRLPKLWRPALAKSKRLHQRSPIVSIPEPLGNACPMFTSLQKWYHNGIILFRDIALSHLRGRPIDTCRTSLLLSAKESYTCLPQQSGSRRAVLMLKLNSQTTLRWRNLRSEVELHVLLSLISEIYNALGRLRLALRSL